MTTLSELKKKLQGLGATLNGRKGTYRITFNCMEYMLLVNLPNQCLSIAEYVTTYNGQPTLEEFETAIETVKEFQPDYGGACIEEEKLAYLASPEYKFEEVLTKERFEKMWKDFDDAYTIMFGTLFMMTDPNILL